MQLQKYTSYNLLGRISSATILLILVYALGSAQADCSSRLSSGIAAADGRVQVRGEATCDLPDPSLRLTVTINGTHASTCSCDQAECPFVGRSIGPIVNLSGQVTNQGRQVMDNVNTGCRFSNESTSTPWHKYDQDRVCGAFESIHPDDTYVLTQD